MQRCESWEDVPLEFSRLSIDTIIISVASPGLDPCNSVLPSFVGFRLKKDPSEAQHRIWEDIDFCALKIDNCFITNQWQLSPWMLSQWILSKLLISSCSLTNFSEMSNICFKVRSLEFKMKFWKVEKFFPMNVAAFIVATMNIPQIIECFSPESATFDILFCLLRTWSLTMFTNSAASLPMTKFSKLACSWWCTDTSFTVLSWIVSPYLAECAFPPRRCSSR